MSIYYKDEYEKGVKNLSKGIQGLAVRLSVCVCMRNNERRVSDCTQAVHTHDRVLSAIRLR